MEKWKKYDKAQVWLQEAEKDGQTEISKNNQ